MKRIRCCTLLPLSLLIAGQLFALQLPQSESGLITLDTLLTYRSKNLGPVQWQADGKGYLMLEPSPAAKNILEIIRYDAATGERTRLVPADKLTPKGASSPLVVEQFDLSSDGQKLLIFTNSERVWRSNTRGDYWVLDLKSPQNSKSTPDSSQLRKLGGDAKPSTLMFAKFSPDATRAAYVRQNKSLR